MQIPPILEKLNAKALFMCPHCSAMVDLDISTTSCPVCKTDIDYKTFYIGKSVYRPRRPSIHTIIAFKYNKGILIDIGHRLLFEEKKWFRKKNQ